MLVKAPLAAGTIYVANTAGTSGNIGSKENPYTSLAKAVKEAADRTTIVVLEDMTIEEPITVEGKSIKIQSEESNRVTLTRGESMGTKNDGRGWYNPAMIEVTVPAGTSSASLTLENIILDDAGKKCGEYFAQPSTDWSGKTTLSYKEQGKFLCLAPGADPGGKAAEMRQGALQLGRGPAGRGHHLCGDLRAGRSGLPHRAGHYFADCFGRRCGVGY